MNLASLRKRFLGGNAGSVLRGMAALAAGNSIARVIGLASIPFLTRIYAPSDFGLLSVVMASALILAPLLSLGYSSATPLPRLDAVAINLLAVSITLALITSTAATLGLFFTHGQVFSALSIAELSDWWWTVVAAAVLLEASECFSMWATRRKAYSAISRSQVLQAGFAESSKAILGILGLKPLGLPIGFLIGLMVGSTGLSIKFLEDYRRLKRYISLRRAYALARRYIAFPSYRLPSQVLVLLSMQVPILMASALYGPASAGQLGLAMMALALPANLIGESMAKAFYAEAAAMARHDSAGLKLLTSSVITRLLALAIAPALLLLLAGPWAFPLAFGEQWEKAGIMASILALYLLFQFAQKPIPYVMYLVNRQHVYLFISIQRVLVSFLSFWIPWRLGATDYATLAVYSISLSVHQIISIKYALHIITRPGRGER